MKGKVLVTASVKSVRREKRRRRVGWWYFFKASRMGEIFQWGWSWYRRGGNGEGKKFSFVIASLSPSLTFNKSKRRWERAFSALRPPPIPTLRMSEWLITLGLVRLPRGPLVFSAALELLQHRARFLPLRKKVERQWEDEERIFKFFAFPPYFFGPKLLFFAFQISKEGKLFSRRGMFSRVNIDSISLSRSKTLLISALGRKICEQIVVAGFPFEDGWYI